MNDLESKFSTLSQTTKSENNPVGNIHLVYNIPVYIRIKIKRLRNEFIFIAEHSSPYSWWLFGYSVHVHILCECSHQIFRSVSFQCYSFFHFFLFISVFVFIAIFHWIDDVAEGVVRNTFSVFFFFRLAINSKSL